MAINNVGPGEPGDFEQVAVSTAAVGLSAAKYQVGAVAAGRAVITVDGDAIRYRIDGGDPTGSAGHVADDSVLASERIVLESFGAIVRFRAIRVTTDATLNVTYYREGKAQG